MDKKQIRNLVLMLIVLIVCIGGYFGMKGFREKEEAADMAASEEANAKTPVFDKVSANDIEGISWNFEGEDISIKKGDKGYWYYGSVSLNEGKPSSWTSDIASLEATNAITGDDVNLDSFGLTEPSKVITASLKDGSSIKVAIGIQNTITNEYYCYINDDKTKVYTISSTLYNDFNTGVEDFLAKE